jgi:stearoyl-CoA desaturase (delta-9 desaturase)
MNYLPLLALVIHWYTSLFCQTFFLHRYSAHGMFKLSHFMDRFFYLLTYITQGPSFLNPRAYALLHQAHHKYSDTEMDPHSPHIYTSLKKMMLKTYHDYHSLVKNPIGMRTDHHYPTWPALDKFAQTYAHTFFWIALYAFAYQYIATEWWHWGFLIIHLLMGPIQGAIVNWFGHKLGYRNYDMPDKSTNSLPVDILLMGELYQNNHHRHPMKLNFASRWFEWDPTYPIIGLMKLFRLIRI